MRVTRNRPHRSSAMAKVLPVVISCHHEEETSPRWIAERRRTSRATSCAKSPFSERVVAKTINKKRKGTASTGANLAISEGQSGCIGAFNAPEGPTSSPPPGCSWRRRGRKIPSTCPLRTPVSGLCLANSSTDQRWCWCCSYYPSVILSSPWARKCRLLAQRMLAATC